MFNHKNITDMTRSIPLDASHSELMTLGEIKENYGSALDGSPSVYCGTYRKYNEGSLFVKAATGTVKAFEAYASNIKPSEAAQFQIVLDENAEDGPDFLLGDVNNDGKLSISDVSELIDYLLFGEEEVTINLDAADVNGDNNVSIADATELLDIILFMQ